MPFLLVPAHCISHLCSRFFSVWLSPATKRPNPPRRRSGTTQFLGVVLLLSVLGWLPGARGAELILSWTDNSNNEEGFQIDRSIAGGPFLTIARTGPNVVTYTDNTLLPATFYSYRLRAYKGSLASAFTTIVGATTKAILSTTDAAPSTSLPVNTAPTISTIASRSITLGAVTAAIPFTIGDTTTAATALTVRATSSNLAVLPLASLVLGGTGANRTLTLRPSSVAGTTTITVTVSDGALTATRTFSVTIAPPNTAPTISALTSRSIALGAVTAAIPFTIGDTTTATTALVVRATSSNLAVLPLASLVLGGTGANRTLTLRPPSAAGTSTITVTVSDGALTASRTFTVSVTAPNTAPTISALTSRSIAQGAVTAAIPFTIGDTTTATTALVVRATSSNLAVLPLASLVLGGTGANRSLTLRPPSAAGTTTITVTVSDGALTASRSFTVSVTAPNTPPTMSAIASRSIALGAVTAAIPFTVGDTATTASALQVRVTSSNLAVLPQVSLVLGGTGASRTLTLRPPSAAGTSLITVTVSDGALTATQTFSVSVPAPNTPPTVSALSTRSVEVGAVSAPIAFTISDSTTAASALVVTATSSNAAVVPASALGLGGTGGSRTLTLAPLTAVGSAVVTVSVSDGSLSASQSFTVTVTPFDPPPVLNGLEDLTTSVNGLIRQLFTTVDASNSAGPSGDEPALSSPLTITAVSSNPALLPTSALTVTGTPGLRVLGGSLVAGETGTTVITVSVSNGRKVTRGSFNLTVVAPNTAPWISNLVSESSRPAPFFGQPFTAGDAETSAESLQITATSSNQALVPDSGIRLSSNGIDRAILLLPVRDQTGTTTIRVQVTDGVMTTTQTFTLTVSP